MQERIGEIIEYLIREISQRPDPIGINLEKLSQELLKKGYTEPEIHKAVEWIIMNFNKNQLPISLQSPGQIFPSFRTLSNEELSFFSIEAYGYLIQLQSLKIVNALQIERIIDRCFLMGLLHIELKDIKAIVSQTLIGKEVYGSATSSVYHPGNDKIN